MKELIQNKMEYIKYTQIINLSILYSSTFIILLASLFVFFNIKSNNLKLETLKVKNLNKISEIKDITKIIISEIETKESKVAIKNTNFFITNKDQRTNCNQIKIQ